MQPGTSAHPNRLREYRSARADPSFPRPTARRRFEGLPPRGRVAAALSHIAVASVSTCGRCPPDANHRVRAPSGNRRAVMMRTAVPRAIGAVCLAGRGRPGDGKITGLASASLRGRPRRVRLPVHDELFPVRMFDRRSHVPPRGLARGRPRARVRAGSGRCRRRLRRLLP